MKRKTWVWITIGASIEATLATSLWIKEISPSWNEWNAAFTIIALVTVIGAGIIEMSKMEGGTA